MDLGARPRHPSGPGAQATRLRSLEEVRAAWPWPGVPNEGGWDPQHRARSAGSRASCSTSMWDR